MTKETALAFIAKYPKAISFVRKSHLEELSPLCEVHIEAVEATKENFVDMGKGQWYPRKELIDRMGNAAGIQFSVEPRIVKDPASGSVTVTHFPQELGPDGKVIQLAPTTSEKNPSELAELEWLSGVINKGYKEPTEVQKRFKVLEYSKKVVRLADTSARAAAIISAIGMPTGFKDIFQGTNTVQVLFSRIIMNNKNELVLQHALNTMFGAVKAIAGPSAAQAGPAQSPAAAGAVPAAAVQAEYEDLGASDSFGDDPDPAPDPRTAYRDALQYIRTQHAAKLSEDAKSKIDAALADPNCAGERFQQLINASKDYLARKGVQI